MSKYDFQVDLSQNSSTGIILNKIPRESVVLEFGCAAGRMTRYMKEALGCQVYIVEYDKDAYKTAVKYARDGLCDDIMQFRWAERFNGIEFDAIIFADVLEHLTAPGEVLRRAAEFLKDDGNLYISIPNITHNDVLLKAHKEHFDYTPTGLLDDTHVHFWGMENLEELADACGLSLQRVEGTYCPTGHTEQWDPGEQPDFLLGNILRERQCGEVYQFVLTLGREKTERSVQFKPATIQSHVYLDTGKDFNAEECVMQEAEYAGQGSYRFRYVIADTEKLSRVRFDPVEGQSCILRRMEISQGGKVLELVCPGEVEGPEGRFIPGNDPMVYTQVQPGAGDVVIEADIVLGGGLFLELLQDACTDKHDQTVRLSRQQAELQGRIAGLEGERQQLQSHIDGLVQQQRQFQEHIDGLEGERQQLQSHIDGLEGERQQLQSHIDGLEGERQQLRSHIDGLEGERQQLQGRITGLETERDQMHSCIGALRAEKAALEQRLVGYISLANQKDLYSLQLERNAVDMEKRIQQLQGECAALHGELDTYVALTAYYRNLKVVRVRAFFARIVKGIIRRVKRLMRKEEHK